MTRYYITLGYIHVGPIQNFKMYDFYFITNFIAIIFTQI